MFRACIFPVILLLACLPVFGTTGREKKIADNVAELRKRPHDAVLLKETGYLYLNVDDFDNALAFGQRMLSEGHRQSDSNFLKLHGHIILGQAFTHNSNQAEAFDHLEKARAIGEAMHDHDALCSVYNGLGIYYAQMRGDRHSALGAYTRALAEADSARNEAKQAAILYNLAGLWLYGGNATEVRYAQQAYERAHEMNDVELEFNCCVILSGFGVVSGNAAETKRWLDEASDILEINNLEQKKTYLATAYANYYTMTGDRERAEASFRSAYSHIGDLEPNMRTNLCFHYGNFLSSTGRLRQGIKMLMEGLENTVSGETAVDSCALLLAIARQYNTLGDYKKAFAFMDKHRAATERKHMLADEQAYVENRIKNDIRLNELQVQRQKVQLLERERDLVAVAGLAMVLTVALVLLSFFYRRKNRLYRSIVEQNRQSMARERALIESLDAERKKLTAATEVQSKSGTGEKLAELANRFMLLMVEEHLYADPNISIASVAEALGTNRTYLSKAINSSTGHSFSEIVNQYRIRRAIELISEDGCSHQFKFVAATVGFNSKSAFYTAFRNITGMTPTQYREKVSETSK